MSMYVYVTFGLFVNLCLEIKCLVLFLSAPFSSNVGVSSVAKFQIMVGEMDQ